MYNHSIKLKRLINRRQIRIKRKELISLHKDNKNMIIMIKKTILILRKHLNRLAFRIILKQNIAKDKEKLVYLLQKNTNNSNNKLKNSRNN